MAHVDRSKIKIEYDKDAEVWFLTYDGLPKDTVISYSSNYQYLYDMSEMLVGMYLDMLHAEYNRAMDSLEEGLIC